MAYPTLALIDALRKTAGNLQNGSYHSWGHHGACNCGNLVQTITPFTQDEILRYAHEAAGEWTELAQEFCPITNAPINLILAKLTQIGLTPTDIHHIEYLSDRAVLENLEGGFRWLKRNNKADAVAYFNAFANLLEKQLSKQVSNSLAQVLAKEEVELQPVFSNV
jgi:hypothetical protein